MDMQSLLDKSEQNRLLLQRAMVYNINYNINEFKKVFIKLAILNNRMSISMRLVKK